MKKNPGYFLKNWGLVESNENQKIFKSKSVSIFMKNVRIKWKKKNLKLSNNANFLILPKSGDAEFSILVFRAFEQRLKEFFYTTLTRGLLNTLH